MRDRTRRYVAATHASAVETFHATVAELNRPNAVRKLQRTYRLRCVVVIWAHGGDHERLALPCAERRAQELRHLAVLIGHMLRFTLVRCPIRPADAGVRRRGLCRSWRCHRRSQASPG